MKLNQAGIDLIKSFESCVLHAYPDPATGGAPWTIGYGSTGEAVDQYTIWDQEQADKELAVSLFNTAGTLAPHVKIPLKDNQFSAIVSLAYNVGLRNVLNSSLLRYVNQSNFTAAANEFPKWDKAAGKIMPGLTRRRLAEKRLFES